MANTSDTGADGAPFGYALFGTILLAIGGALFANRIEDPEFFTILTILFAAPGFYLLIAGAVARGIVLARHR